MNLDDQKNKKELLKQDVEELNESWVGMFAKFSVEGRDRIKCTRIQEGRHLTDIELDMFIVSMTGGKLNPEGGNGSYTKNKLMHVTAIGPELRDNEDIRSDQVLEIALNQIRFTRIEKYYHQSREVLEEALMAGTHDNTKIELGPKLDLIHDDMLRDVFEIEDVLDSFGMTGYKTRNEANKSDAEKFYDGLKRVKNNEFAEVNQPKKFDPARALPAHVPAGDEELLNKSPMGKYIRFEFFGDDTKMRLTWHEDTSLDINERNPDKINAKFKEAMKALLSGESYKDGTFRFSNDEMRYIANVMTGGKLKFPENEADKANNVMLIDKDAPALHGLKELGSKELFIDVMNDIRTGRLNACYEEIKAGGDKAAITQKMKESVGDMDALIISNGGNIRRDREGGRLVEAEVLLEASGAYGKFGLKNGGAGKVK